jgi:hypothetical protein
MAPAPAPHLLLTHTQKKPRSSRDRIGAGVLSEELLPEGDQTFVSPAESSVPARVGNKLVENDLFIGMAATKAIGPCRRPVALPESSHDTVP